MDEPLSQTTKVLKKDYSQAPCGECDRETRHRILARTDTHWQSADLHISTWMEYKIIQCQGCLTISFCEISRCTEDADYDVDGNGYFIPNTKYFPNRITGRPVMQGVHHLPHGVYVIYQESHASLCAELPIMAGFGIRAIVESVCIDKCMEGRNLEKKIDSLQADGLITSSGSKILHNLRFMGNAAVHEMRSHSLKELNAAFDVAEYLLQGVYVLPTKAENLPAK